MIDYLVIQSLHDLIKQANSCLHHVFSYVFFGYIQWLSLFDGDRSVPQDWCQFLHVITQYAIVCNFAWMFCEGLYLHTVMMSAFTSGKSVIIACLIIGWGKRNHVLIVLPISANDIYCFAEYMIQFYAILCYSIICKFNTLHCRNVEQIFHVV